MNDAIKTINMNLNYSYLFIAKKNIYDAEYKMIKNSILKLFKKNDFIEREFEIDLQLRPENLEREIFYKLASKYESLLR